MERYSPFEKACFVLAITFRRSSSGCTTVLFRKLFSVTPPLLHVTGFLSVLENKQVRRSFFQCSLWYMIRTLLTELVRSRWLDIGLVLFFLRFYGPRRSRGPLRLKKGTWPLVINHRSCKKIGQQWTILHPRKKNPNLLLDNYSIALKRLEATTSSKVEP